MYETNMSSSIRMLVTWPQKRGGLIKSYKRDGHKKGFNQCMQFTSFRTLLKNNYGIDCILILIISLNGQFKESVQLVGCLTFSQMYKLYYFSTKAYIVNSRIAWEHCSVLQYCLTVPEILWDIKNLLYCRATFLQG